jgi:hypothetical protein
MHAAIPPLSRRDAQLKHRDNFTFTCCMNIEQDMLYFSTLSVISPQKHPEQQNIN